MQIQELITILKKFDQTAYVYLNTDCNIEDEFIPVKADTDNILFVPLYKYGLLSNHQEFTFV